MRPRRAFTLPIWVGSVAVAIVMASPAAAEVHYNIVLTDECSAPGGEGRFISVEVWTSPFSTERVLPTPPTLRGLRVSNPCAEPIAIAIGIPGPTIDLQIAVPSGVSATATSSDLSDAGILRARADSVSFQHQNVVADPCVFDPDLILNADGSLTPAVC